jgi:hypothetical protein
MIKNCSKSTLWKWYFKINNRLAVVGGLALIARMIILCSNYGFQWPIKVLYKLNSAISGDVEGLYLANAVLLFCMISLLFSNLTCALSFMGIIKCGGKPNLDCDDKPSK